MKVTIAEAEGKTLDWLVECALHGTKPSNAKVCYAWMYQNDERSDYSADLAFAGQLIHDQKLMVEPMLENGDWYGVWRVVRMSWDSDHHTDMRDKDLALAIARCVAGAKFGETATVPGVLEDRKPTKQERQGYNDWKNP